MDQLLTAINAVFEDFDEATFRDEMKLSEIPQWDSMNSVNFQMELESLYKISFDDFQLTGKTSIAEVRKFISSKSK